MFKNAQIWVVTFLDLIILVVCFFVLFYSINLSKYNNTGETLFKDTIIEPTSLNVVGNLQIIYNNLMSHYKDDKNNTIEFDRNKGYIRIKNDVNLYDSNSIEDLAKSLASDIYNFSKNQIRMQLLVNYDSLQKSQNSNIELVIRDIMSNFNKFRNAVSEHSNIDTITSIVDIYSNYPIEKGKDWVIVTDILPEQN